jgi:uncharacterized protein YbjT (DUF2867 family)
MTMQKKIILVIGSTGKTGRRIARRLTNLGHTVRHGSRRSSTPFDWEMPRSWVAALKGVDAVYISYFPDLAYPGAEENIEVLTRLAASASVRRVVLLPGRGEYYAQCCEDIVRNPGFEYTLLRAAWFAQNFSEGYLREPAQAGVAALPAGEVREPIVDVDDIADVAVAALTEEGHNGQLFEVTGPRLMSIDEIATTLSAAMGANVQYQPITLEAFHAQLQAIGGKLIADVISGICRETLDGGNAWLGDGVQRALCRQPRDFLDFCHAAAAAGAWEKAA